MKTKIKMIILRWALRLVTDDKKYREAILRHANAMFTDPTYARRVRNDPASQVLRDRAFDPIAINRNLEILNRWEHGFTTRQIEREYRENQN